MSDQYVVDTSVFVRWYVAQNGYEHARKIQSAFLDGEIRLFTTDLACVELAEVLRKKGLLPGLLDRTQYLDAVRDIDDLGVAIQLTDADTLHRAASLAADRNLRVFDALFVDRALQTGYPLLTADIRLVRAVGNLISTEVLRGVGVPESGPLTPRIQRRVGEVPGQRVGRPDDNEVGQPPL